MSGGRLNQFPPSWCWRAIELCSLYLPYIVKWNASIKGNEACWWIKSQLMKREPIKDNGDAWRSWLGSIRRYWKRKWQKKSEISGDVKGIHVGKLSSLLGLSRRHVILSQLKAESHAPLRLPPHNIHSSSWIRRDQVPSINPFQTILLERHRIELSIIPRITIIKLWYHKALHLHELLFCTTHEGPCQTAIGNVYDKIFNNTAGLSLKTTTSTPGMFSVWNVAMPEHSQTVVQNNESAKLS